jgi:hypothetical protein
MGEEMSNLKDDVLALLQTSVKDLWQVEDTEFLRRLTGDIVAEKLAAVTSQNPAIHQQNLLHLAATLQAEIAIKKIAVEKSSLDLFCGIVGAIIRAISLGSLKL